MNNINTGILQQAVMDIFCMVELV